MKKRRRFGLFSLLIIGGLVTCGIIGSLSRKPEEDAPTPTIPIVAARATDTPIPPTRTPFPTITVRATWTVTDTPAPTNTPQPAPATSTVASRSIAIALPTATAAKIAIDTVCSQPNPGNDNTHLADEFICLVNRGDAPVDLQGWLVHDNNRNAEYTFRALVLAPGAIVKLRTGKGENGAADVYWGKGQAVWNNSGDTVYLYDAAGVMADQWNY